MNPTALLVAAALTVPLALYVGGFNGVSLMGVLLAGAATRGYVKKAGGTP